jgi:hypothetical protein
MPLKPFYKPGSLELVEVHDDTERDGNNEYFELYKVFLRLLHQNKRLKQYADDIGFFEPDNFRFVTNDMWIQIFSLLENKEKKQLFEVLPKEKKSELEKEIKMNGGGKSKRRRRRTKKNNLKRIKTIKRKQKSKCV